MYVLNLFKLVQSLFVCVPVVSYLTWKSVIGMLPFSQLGLVRLGVWLTGLYYNIILTKSLLQIMGCFKSGASSLCGCVVHFYHVTITTVVV